MLTNKANGEIASTRVIFFQDLIIMWHFVSCHQATALHSVRLIMALSKGNAHATFTVINLRMQKSLSLANIGHEGSNHHKYWIIEICKHNLINIEPFVSISETIEHALIIKRLMIKGPAGCNSQLFPELTSRTFWFNAAVLYTSITITQQSLGFLIFNHWIRLSHILHLFLWVS
jgi:hypothetical protein